MSGLVIALALFGCSDDATVCERLTHQARSFHSRAECELAIESAFESDLVLRADYPTVIARCMDMGHLARLGDKPVDLSGKQIRLASRAERGGA